MDLSKDLQVNSAHAQSYQAGDSLVVKEYSDDFCIKFSSFLVIGF